MFKKNISLAFRSFGIKSLAFIGLSLINGFLFAQKQSHIEITNADVLTMRRIAGEEVKVLRGNVGFKQEGIAMHCDSAFFYDSRNTISAFGDVVINQGDSAVMRGAKLDYDGNKKYAVIRENVSLTDGKVTLLTDRLDYDRERGMAFYLDGGTMNDGESRLTSRHGYYFAQSRDLFFKKDVVLVNPDYTLKCDTLKYNTATHRAYFISPTTIEGKKDLIYCESGWYNTKTNLARLGKNAYVRTGSQYLYGDSLFYDRTAGYGSAEGNVRIRDTVEHLLIEGQYAEHYQNPDKTFITKEVFLTKGFKKDSLYLTADTLRAEYDSSHSYRILRGYRQARIYDKDFQPACDSLVYSFKDSTIQLFIEPVFWFGDYQATSQHIRILTKNNNLDKAYLTKDAMIIKPEDSVRFDQIKGRNMTGFFEENELRRVAVDGNGQAIYYAKDDSQRYIGANRITSGNIEIGMKKQKVSTIRFSPQSDGVVLPIKDADPKDLTLGGFKNRGAEKPKSIDDLKAFAKISSVRMRPISTEPVEKTPVKKKKKNRRK